ncbi:MAG: FAD-dependent monooxygenase, partial [Pseudomonadota bacterium]
ETLERAGAWAAMQEDGAPLRTMRLVDAGGREPVVRETADFTADAAGRDMFGWNVPNAAARTALLARIGDLPNVHRVVGESVKGYVSRTDEAILRLSGGDQIAARLVLAADGRGSTLRELAGLKVRRWPYGQSALIFAVTHTEPHDGVSTEIHRTGGPLTLVPMPDLDGKPCSSVVWMVPTAEAKDLNALDDAELSTELTARTMGLFGPLVIATPRAVWPISAQVAPVLIADRLALMAEAAHVMPPIGAQGLNTSLHDVETIATLIAGTQDPGAPSVLDAYQRKVAPRMLARVAGVDLLNRAAQADAQPLRDLRHLGLKAINRNPILKALAVRAGMGA